MSLDPRRLERARWLLEAHRYREALHVLRDLVAAGPDEVEPQLLLVSAHGGLGDQGAALATAERCAALAPDDPRPHLLRAELLAAFARQGEALDAAREAVRLGPEDWVSYVVLARVAAERRYSRRLAAWAAETAMRIAPEHPDPHVAHGVVLWSRHRRRAARRSFRAALGLDPQHAEARLLLADTRTRDSSPRALAAALRSDPLAPHLHQELDRRVWSAVTGLWFGLSLCSLNLMGAREQGRWLVLAAIGTVLVVVVGLVVGRTPRHLWRPVGRHLRSHPSQLVLASLVVLGLANAVVVVVLPAGWRSPPAHLVAWGLVVVVGVPTYLLGRRARRRRGLPT